MYHSFSDPSRINQKIVRYDNVLEKNELTRG